MDRTGERRRGPGKTSFRTCRECQYKYRVFMGQRKAEASEVKRSYTFCSTACKSAHIERCDRRGKQIRGLDWNEALAKRAWTYYLRRLEAQEKENGDGPQTEATQDETPQAQSTETEYEALIASLSQAAKPGTRYIERPRRQGKGLAARMARMKGI